MAEPEAPRTFTPLWITVAALLGVVAVGGRHLAESPQLEKKSAKEAANADRSSLEETPLRPLQEFLMTEEGNAPNSASEIYQRLSKKYDVDFLIVTMPDPVDSRFGFSFDRMMAVTQRAMAECGYVFDRAWLPWEIDKNKLKDKATNGSSVQVGLFGASLSLPTNFTDKKGAYREKFPGVLLFRDMGPSVEALKGKIDKEKKGKLWIVHVIGENPTAGLDRRAFTQSLHLIADSSATAAQLIRIVGPFFSGSQTSLKHILSHWTAHHSTTRFEVISGGATAVDKTKLFPNHENVKFHATINKSENILQATLHYLKHKNQAEPVWKHPSQGKTGGEDRLDGVAFLVESNTTFGQNIKESKLIGADSLRLPFPLHIAEVASSYEKEQRLKDEQSGIPRLDALIPRLGFSPGPNSDLIPPQDPATTASTNGKILSDILSAITRKRIRFVGIVASDTRDTIFLACSIREHCPDVQIFILGSDLLYSLPEFNYYLRGTIIGSTYPLITANQRWTDTDSGSRQLFPSDSTEGTYNAILAQLNKPEKLIEYRPPHLPRTPPEEPTQVDRPPIWITMIGQNGDRIPLHFFTHPEPAEKKEAEEEYLWLAKSELTAPASPAGMRLALPGVTYSLLALICAFAGLVFAWLGLRPAPHVYWGRPGNPGLASFWWEILSRIVLLASVALFLLPVAHLCSIFVKNNSPVSSHDSQIWSVLWTPIRFLLLGLPWLALSLAPITLLLLLARDGGRFLRAFSVRVGVVAGTAIAFLWIFNPPVWEYGGMPHLFACAFFVALSPTVFSSSLPTQGGGQVVSSSRLRLTNLRLGLALLTAVLVIWAVWKFLVYLRTTPVCWEVLFFQRSLNFPSGASLLLPLFFLCATFFIWAFFQMKGGEDVRHFSILSPYPSIKEHQDRDPFAEVRKLGHELRNERRSLRAFAKKHFGLLTLLAVALVAGVFRMWDLWSSVVEGPFWDTVFFFGLTLGFLLVAFNLFRFLAYWSRFRKLLHELTLVPMMGAFAKLPDKVTTVFGGYLRPPRPRGAHLSIPLHQLTPLADETHRLLDEMSQRPTRLPPSGEEPTADDQVALNPMELRDVVASLGAFEEVRKQNDSARPAVPSASWLARMKDMLSGAHALDEEQAQGVHNPLSKVCRKLLTYLPRFWPRRSITEAFGCASQGKNAKSKADVITGSGDAGVVNATPRPSSTPARFAKWVELAEGLVAIQVLIYISQFFIRLRNLASSLIITSSLLVFTVTSYPFQPGQLILYTMLGLLGAVSVGIIYVLIMVNRDELVSRIVGTTPNSFTPDLGFLNSVFTYVVPALGIVTLQLSGGFRFLLEPILRVLK
jgi:hypothetical protein